MKHFLVVLLIAMFSCNEEPGPEVEQGYDFFPVQSGHYRIYEVDQILYIGAEADSSHFFLKEVIADSLISGDQTVTYLLERYKTTDTTLSVWELDSVWTIRRNSRQGIVTENNVPFVKMVFPVKSGKSWDGNALNTRDVQMYYYQITEGDIYLGTEVKDMIRVVIEDVPENLVEHDERSEVYGRGIGLIEKDYTSVMFCQSGCTPGQIEDGRIYRQRLIAYGEE